MSNLAIFSIACIARSAPARSGPPSNSGNTDGTICQNTPKRSRSHPHRRTDPPLDDSASQRWSTSAWSAQSILNETAWVYSNRVPPLRAILLAGERELDHQYGAGLAGGTIDGVLLD